MAAQELENREEIAYQEFLQFLFYRQWRALRDYARENGVQIIGDVPIYVDADSADVWTEPWFFELDARCRPIDVAGVPPDYFCAEGQLWGNPLYDWERIRADGWGWWIRRIDGARALYDVIRIDHFRAFASFWAVPFGQATAINGRWRAGPGEALVSALQGWFPGVEFIAEDLGILTPDVGRLIRKTGLPGMGEGRETLADCGRIRHTRQCFLPQAPPRIDRRGKREDFQGHRRVGKEVIGWMIFKSSQSTQTRPLKCWGSANR